MVIPSLVEMIREKVVSGSFNTQNFNRAFHRNWKPAINSFILSTTTTYSPNGIFDLGDNLSNIFFTTRGTGRGGHTTTASANSTLSAAGHAWENLVTWYLNLCLAGTNAVAVKYKSLIPESVRDSLTVQYGTYYSTSEMDIVVLVFPNLAEYSVDFSRLRLSGSTVSVVPIGAGGRKPAFSQVLNTLCDRDFIQLSVGIIQCKTNWNDSVQVPMLWDMIYSASRAGTSFRSPTPIAVGRSGRSIRSLSDFSYSFVTVPTNNYTSYSPSGLPVMRIQNVSGGNYWGYASVPRVALSLKEIFNRNFAGAYGATPIITHITTNVIPNLSGTFSYFNI